METLRAIPVFLVLAGVGCASRGTSCAAPSCGTGYECLANRCVPSGDDPVPSNTDRVVLEPVACTVADDHGGPGVGSVTLGNETGSPSVLYLRFDQGWKANAQIAAAFLLLEPSPGTAPNADVPLTVWTIGARWSSDRIAKGVRPSLLLPRAEGVARQSPRSVVRVDVTSVVRNLAEDDYGLAVTASVPHGSGVTLLTGASGGPPPRLEIYLRR